jgi:hypothetical protein
MGQVLSVKIEADATDWELKYQKVLAEIVAGNKSASTASVQAAAQQVRAVEQQIAANELYAKSESNLLLIKERQIAMAKFVAAYQRQQAATTNPIAVPPVTPIPPKVPQSVMNLNKLLGQLLIIIKDIARGQWARAFSTLTSLLTGLGFTFSFLLGVLIPIVGIGYAVIKTFKEIGDGADYVADRIGLMTARFRAQAEAIRNAARESENFAEWLERLHEIRNEQSLAKDAEEDVKALRKKFEMEQRSPFHQHDTQQRKLEREQQENQLEANVYARYAKLAGQVADKAESEARSVETRNAPIINRKEADLSVSSQAANHAAEVFAQVLGHYGQQTSGGTLGRLWNSQGLAGTFTSVGAMGDQQINLGNGHFSSFNQAKAEFDATMRKQAADAATLDAAKKETEDAKRRADKTARDAATTQRQADAAKDIASATSGVDVTGLPKHHGILTENQRIGAFIGGHQASVLQVNQQMARTLVQIHAFQVAHAKKTQLTTLDNFQQFLTTV